MIAEVMPGYKQTEVGVIPADWKIHQLVEISSSIASGRSKVDTEFGQFPVFGSTGVIGYTNTPSHTGESILVARVGANAGFLNSADGRYGVTDNTIAIRLKPGSDHIYCLLQLKRYGLGRLIFGSGQPLITGTQLKGIPIPTPAPEEQVKIVSALSEIDALIRTLDQLIAKKRDIQQATMQQLLTGQRRLPGFSGEWEVKRLGDFGQCLRGVSYKGDADLLAYDTDETYRLLRSNNVQQSAIDVDGLQFVNARCVSSHQVLKHKDILICMANGSKDLVGKAGLFKVSDGHRYTFGAFMGCFRMRASAEPDFIFALFGTNKYKNYIANLLAGSSINNLRPRDIEQMEFRFPPKDEQAGIASLLSDMDSELAALEARRNKACQLKQGMMQELLTGRIRLV